MGLEKLMFQSRVLRMYFSARRISMVVYVESAQRRKAETEGEHISSTWAHARDTDELKLRKRDNPSREESVDDVDA
jgi:hypothetical protein